VSPRPSRTKRYAGKCAFITYSTHGETMKAGVHFVNFTVPGDAEALPTTPASAATAAERPGAAKTAATTLDVLAYANDGLGVAGTVRA
jgi:hypothetical protein